MYAVMWSEHCSYKSSRAHLGRFPTEAPWVLVGPGEGAGVIDVGDGLAVAIRIESHNHPSAVEPYQGAATGVGGIIRDIFSMGARPIALMDPLRFGSLDDAAHPLPLRGRRVGHQRLRQRGRRADRRRRGRVRRHATATTRSSTCCASASCPIERLVLARAEGVGNLAVLLGSSTGRDGIGGASVLASAGFEEGGEAKRPSVQVGDPFEEKRLIEACLELLDRGLAVGVQDLGAAGLSCAASETAAKTGAGMDVDVARVAKREPGMNPVEVHDVREPGAHARDRRRPSNLDAVLELARAVGDPRDGRRARHRHRALPRVRRAVRRDRRAGREPARRRSATTPPALVVRPRADRRRARRQPRRRSAATTARSRGPPTQDALQADDPAPQLRAQVPAGTDLGAELLALLATPTIADKSWVSRQYDHQLFLNTVVGPGGDAAVLRLKGTTQALALATDGKARFCRLDPRTGGRLAVLEAARNVACTGARPLALVNCLNFGNPEHPEVMWQFSEVVDGMSEACDALGIPVVGGNVSFYNESRGADIDPTPVVGVIGLIDELARRAARRRGCAPATRSSCSARPGPSSAARSGPRSCTACDGGMPPAADLDAARALHELVADLVASARSTVCTTSATAVSRSRSREMAIARRGRVPGRPRDRRLHRGGSVLLRVGVARRARRSRRDTSRRARLGAARRACPRRSSAPPAATGSSPPAPSTSRSPTPPSLARRAPHLMAGA